MNKTSIMFDSKLERTLIAQTPLIHFQHDETGATLRATEVKPKLDRYLIRIWQKENPDKAVPSDWLIPKQPRALRYKLRLCAVNDGEIVTLGYRPKTPNLYDIFYGNMGDGPEKKGVIRNVSLTILCNNAALKRFIEQHLSDFFICTNFGTMQNKGFGSFVVDGETLNEGRIATALTKAYDAPTCYCFNGGDTPFKKIKTVYSIMKSGINLSKMDPQKYKRSMLFEFMHKTYRLGNEKAWLKSNNMVPVLGASDPHSQDHPFYYVRALLGVGDHVDYLRSTEPKAGKLSVKISGVTKKGDNIERFSSPIFFKVIGRKVYYVAKRIENIYEATFTFKGYSEKTLNVPSKELLGDDFIDKFLAYVCQDFNNNCPAGLKNNITITEVKAI